MNVINIFQYRKIMKIGWEMCKMEEKVLFFDRKWKSIVMSALCFGVAMETITTEKKFGIKSVWNNIVIGLDQSGWYGTVRKRY